MLKFDVVIIGGGITGTAIARELSKFDLKAALLEANMDIASGTTKGNGGVIHSGYDPNPSTMKAKVNCKGALMYPKLAKELGFEYKNTGSMVVGFEDKDTEVLNKLYENGKKNGVPGLRIIERDEIFKIEPRVNRAAKYALYAPTAGIADPFEVAIAFAENASENDVKIYRNQKVVGITKNDEFFNITTQNREYQARFIVNAAGVYGDYIAKLVGIEDYEIKPRFGELLVMDKAIGFELNTVLFPLPGNRTKGIVVIPTVHGNIIVGSTARMTEDKEDISVTKEGIEELLNGAKHLVPDIEKRFLIRQFAGLRPVETNTNDFVIEASKKVKGFINAIGIQSPGVASAPAIAEMVRDILSNEGLDLKEKKSFNPYRTPILDFSELTDEEKDELIRKKPSYGRVICRCETVTEGEILSAINRPVGAVTVDGVKRRTRAGMGRCQGGFCQHRIVSILSRELGIPKDEVLLENEKSKLIFGKMKGQEESRE
ncbi:NAD(P)/FAD-dependent oxidoreductase [Fonticella tunisiensis]|uniref:Glycerol-3-phosphate dehydrogenase n=1 Tax=Fonticella tunisiensis TaxID=1096341 RepID=A0A4R7KQ59_9CLOT|nr:FAD-dependent oxidoreductase [Fonticella tunisiensis]TDT61279.1 glycerol-3-phosphate dehydrogenase [Fonticella tunisiensis]